jgi:hypothetical protein
VVARPSRRRTARARIGKLPAGTGRTFTAEAFNSGGTKLYAGTATGVTLLARQTTAVSITLQEADAPAPFENTAPVITSLPMLYSTNVTPCAPVCALDTFLCCNQCVPISGGSCDAWCGPQDPVEYVEYAEQ